METGGGGGGWHGNSAAVGGGGADGGVDVDCCGSSNVLATVHSEFPMAAAAVPQISGANPKRSHEYTIDVGVVE